MRATGSEMNPHRIKIEKGCVVDASHKDEWWTGLVIKESKDGDKFLVLFDSPLDIVQFERKSLRLHFDEQCWILSLKNTELLRRLTEESVFSSGTMVEVSSKRGESEIVWVPAMFVKEIDEKKCIVKFCDKDLSFVTSNSTSIKTVDLCSLRPTPPPVSVKEYRFQQYVEVRHWKEWRQGQVVKFHPDKWCAPGKWCVVLLLATNKEAGFKISDIRPLQVWEDGVWKTIESSSGNKMGGSAMNGNTASLAKEAGPPGIAATPWKQTQAKTQGNTLPPIRMQNGSENDIKQENETSEDDNRKRKREENLSSVTNVDETKAKKTAMVLPFEKKLPIWETLDSMEVFKTFPQSPHFIPLLERREEDSREMGAVALMFTYATLIEELKGVQLLNRLSKVIRLSNSLAMLENHGFDIKAPRSRIHKLLSLRDKHLKKTEERKGVQKRIAKKESEMVENKRKILELLKLNEEANKEIAQMKSSASIIDQELKDVELESSSWNPW